MNVYVPHDPDDLEPLADQLCAFCWPVIVMAEHAHKSGYPCCQRCLAAVGAPSTPKFLWKEVW